MLVDLKKYFERSHAKTHIYQAEMVVNIKNQDQLRHMTTAPVDMEPDDDDDDLFPMIVGKMSFDPVRKLVKPLWPTTCSATASSSRTGALRHRKIVQRHQEQAPWSLLDGTR